MADCGVEHPGLSDFKTDILPHWDPYAIGIGFSKRYKNIRYPVKFSLKIIFSVRLKYFDVSEILLVLKHICYLS